MSRKKRYLKKLTEEQKSSLEKGYKTGKTHLFRTKCRCILLSSQGKSVPELEQILEFSSHSIYKWFTLWETQGLLGLKLKPGRGRKPKLSVDNIQQVKQVKKALKKDAQKLDQLLDELEQVHQIHMSKRTLQRFLKSLVTDGSECDAG